MKERYPFTFHKEIILSKPRLSTASPVITVNFITRHKISIITQLLIVFVLTMSYD